jgi:GGDEF domain-containing protein
MLGFNLNPPTSLPFETQPSLTGLQIRQRLTNLKPDIEITQTSNVKLEQMKSIDQECRVLEQRLSDLKPLPRVIPRDQYPQIVSHASDYRYRLFDDSKPYKTITSIPTCPPELRFDTISSKQLSNMIETFIAELQQAIDLKDFSLSKKTQYDIDVIKMIQERYNHKWSNDVINDLTLKETQKFINMKEHLLRMYYHLLRQNVAQIQGGMIPKMLPPDLIEQFDSLKQELSGFNFSLDGTTIDQLLGVYLPPPPAVASSLVDILAGEVAQGTRTSVQSTEDVIRYLQYYLIHDLHRLFVGAGRNRKQFIAAFIEMINKNHQINDTTGQEVDDIKNANSYAKYQEYKTNDAKMTSDTSVGKAEDNKFIISQMRRAGLTGRIDLDTGSIVREHVVASGGEQEAETGGLVETKTGVEEFLDGQMGNEDKID